MRERISFEREIRDLDSKTPSQNNARATGKWKSPADPFDQGQAKLIDQMFTESPLISLFLKNAVKKKVTVAGNLQISNHTDYVQRLAQQLQDLKEYVSALDTEHRSNRSLGLTDKKVGKIFLHDPYNRGRVKVEGAVHEGIHLIAFPAGAAKVPSTPFRDYFKVSFDEGVTQYFTEKLLAEQGFSDERTQQV